MTATRLTSVLRRARTVLFDFDGPICSVFAGYPASCVAQKLHDHLATIGADLHLTGPQAEDPLEVLRLAAALGDDVVRQVDNLLTLAETTAVRTAVPTPGGESSIRAWAASGRRIAIVSNNSTAAVNAYLTHHGLALVVGVAVIGREYAKPHLMKPDPQPLLAALHLLGAEPESAVLVGDSPTDIQAAHAAGVMCIGYVNKPGKREALRDADAVIDDMAILAEQLAQLPRVVEQ